MIKRIKITSYFSLPTDLAKEMRDWKEFVSGENYTVNLKNADSGEIVAVRYVKTETAFDYVVVESNSPGELFDKVVGRAIIALIPHSDNLMINR
ncbi:MAG TPA: hypothetical protein VF540_13460 [Segetibacter sp.]|jgi:hypothetical protein